MPIDQIAIEREPERIETTGYVSPQIKVKLPYIDDILVSERKNPYLTAEAILNAINRYSGFQPTMKRVEIQHQKTGDSWEISATIQLENNHRAHEGHAAAKDVVEAIAQAYVRALFSTPKIYWERPIGTAI